MEYNKLEHYLSRPRLSRFLIACGNSQAECRKLYGVNIKVSQGFYPVLNLFEVIFRNVCNNQLSSELGSPDWIIKEKKRLFSDKSLEKSKYFLRESVQNAERNISKRNGSVTPEKIIGELPFGFWTTLFDNHHYVLVKGCVIKAFPDKPGFINRKTLNKKLSRIREFRNRVYHNEPVCFKDDALDFEYAKSIRDEIYELLKWIDPELPEYVGSFDTILESIDSVNN